MTVEDDRTIALQLNLMLSATGIKGSGFTRYAAAMYFHQNRMLDSAALEVFRSLAKDDAADAWSIVCEHGCAISPVINNAFANLGYLDGIK